MTLSAAMLNACAASIGVRPPSDARRQAVEDGRRAAPDVFDEPILRALAIGLNAPSPHNSQSWLFDIASHREAYLRVDASRLLPETDPPARQVHIGCGCFIEAFVLGASTLGWRAEVELFPEGTYESPSGVGTLPVARLRLAGRHDAPPHPLAPLIFSRQTSRLVYSGGWVTQDVFARVLADAAIDRSHVRLITSQDLPPYLEVLDRAMTVEFNTLATNEETRRWFRFSSDEAARERDGLTFEANGITGLSATFARWFTDDTRASWNSNDTIEKGLASFREALHSARGLVLLSTDANAVNDQVEAGRDCYRLMLALARHGYFCHPVNQVVQEYAAMEGPRRAFEKLSAIRPPAKVQMILRIGRSAAPYVSYRRQLTSFIPGGKEGRA